MMLVDDAIAIATKGVGMRIWTLLLLLVLLGTGCATTRSATYVDPDGYSMVEGTGMEARDIRAVATEMTAELLACQAINGFAGVPRLAVMPVENRSSQIFDAEILTTLITDTLIQNTVGKMAFLNRADIDEIMRERDMKRSGVLDNQGSSSLAGADFFVTGEVRSLTASTADARTDYFVIRFQLTDAESSIIQWSNSYEFKKEGSWGVMYQ